MESNKFSHEKNFIVIGLTGGIATGKSTVTQKLRTLGFFVVDADQTAKDLTTNNGAAIDSIRQHFGDEFIDSNGNLDRDKMRNLVFQKPDKRKELESILHPQIHATAESKFIERHQKTKEQLFFYDAALLVETGSYKKFDGLLMIHCDEKTQIQRLKDRDNKSEKEIQKILNAQLSTKEKAKVADWVLDNSGSLQDLDPHLAHILDQIKSSFNIS